MTLATQWMTSPACTESRPPRSYRPFSDIFLFCSDNFYRCFQTEKDSATILALLSSPENLKTYASNKMPHCFQGTASFAITFLPQQRERIFGLVMDDGNGFWKESNNRISHGKVVGEPSSFTYLSKDWYSRPGGKANGFRRRLLAIVLSTIDCKAPSVDFLVVQYCWMNKKHPEKFEPGRSYTRRAVLDAMRKLASPVARGKVPSPRDIYFEVSSAVPEDDLKLNPYCGPKGIRQATSVKAKAKKDIFGLDAETYLRSKAGVILRQFQNEDGSKSEAFILCDPYHVGLIAVLGRLKLNGKIVDRINLRCM